MSNFRYSEGQRVSFRITDEIYGTGTIVGAATEPIIVMGRFWIVQKDTDVVTDAYPFSCLMVSEAAITELL